MKVIPAILEADLSSIEGRLRAIRGATELVQVDIVDRSFSERQTWPLNGQDQHDEFTLMLEGGALFPHWDDFDIQFDLMVEDPAYHAPRFASLGAQALIVHCSSHSAMGAITLLQRARQSEPRLEVGLALLPSDSADDFEAYEGLCDFVQVMGIARPGSQGEPFDARSVGLIAALRAKFPRLTIQVDGGVGEAHLAEVLRAGADCAAIGSSIFAAPDPRRAFGKLVSTPIL